MDNLIPILTMGVEKWWNKDKTLGLRKMIYCLLKRYCGMSGKGAHSWTPSRKSETDWTGHQPPAVLDGTQLSATNTKKHCSWLKNRGSKECAPSETDSRRKTLIIQAAGRNECWTSCRKRCWAEESNRRFKRTAADRQRASALCWWEL